MKILAILSLTVLLAACNEPPVTQANQCIRAELFKQCMAILPKGPERIAVAGNDWDEVVGKCESSAYYQSLRRTETIPMECRIQ